MFKKRDQQLLAEAYNSVLNENQHQINTEREMNQAEIKLSNKGLKRLESPISNSTGDVDIVGYKDPRSGSVYGLFIKNPFSFDSNIQPEYHGVVYFPSGMKGYKYLNGKEFSQGTDLYKYEIDFFPKGEALEVIDSHNFG